MLVHLRWNGKFKWKLANRELRGTGLKSQTAEQPEKHFFVIFSSFFVIFSSKQILSEYNLEFNDKLLVIPKNLQFSLLTDR